MRPPRNEAMVRAMRELRRDSFATFLVGACVLSAVLLFSNGCGDEAELLEFCTPKCDCNGDEDLVDAWGCTDPNSDRNYRRSDEPACYQDCAETMRPCLIGGEDINSCTFPGGYCNCAVPSGG